MTTRPLSLAAALILGCTVVSSLAQGMAGDIFLTGSGGGTLTGGAFAVVTGNELLPGGKMGPAKHRALILIQVPPGMSVNGSGSESSPGIAFSGSQTIEVQTKPKDFTHLKKLKIGLALDGHAHTAKIGDRAFDWAKNQVFLVVYNRDWKRSVYPLTRNLKGAYIPPPLLRSLQEELPGGIDSTYML